jgi:hypothetical protein
MKDKLPIGTTVTLIEARSAVRQEFAGVIAGHDPATGNYMVVRYEIPKVGHYSVPVESCPHPVRIAPPSAEPVAGEIYFIKSVTGSPDYAAMVQTLVERVGACEARCDAAIAAMAKEVADMKHRHTCALQTAAQPQYVGDEGAKAIKTALTQGVVVDASPIVTADETPTRLQSVTDPEVVIDIAPPAPPTSRKRREPAGV